jgi:hypothetical protein
VKKVILMCVALLGIFASTSSFAQFNPSNGFQTINNTCGTYFLQNSTYYNYQGVSVGSTLPVCIAPFTIQNSSAATVIPAKYVNASLPACSTTTVGLIAVESDGAASPVYAATATGGGSLSVQVMCTYNGSTYAWTNH